MYLFTSYATLHVLNSKLFQLSLSIPPKGQSNAVMVNNITPSTASLSWTALTENTVYQIIYTGPDGVEITFASGTNSASLSNLVPGFMYTFRVQADIGTTTFVVGTATTNTGWSLAYVGKRNCKSLL